MLADRRHQTISRSWWNPTLIRELTLAGGTFQDRRDRDTGSVRMVRRQEEMVREDR